MPASIWRRRPGRLAGLSILALLCAIPARPGAARLRPPSLYAQSVSLAEIGGNNDLVVDPGEQFSMRTLLRNNGNQPATGVSGALSVLSGSAAIQDGSGAYADIQPSQAVTTTEPYVFTISPSHPCGARLVLRETVSFNANLSMSHPVTLQVGLAVPGTPVTRASTDVPKAIPDNAAEPTAVQLPISAAGEVGDVNVRISVTHGYVQDLEIQLRAPDGRIVQLAMRRGEGGNNFTDTIFDDEAQTGIDAGQPPFTGSFRPEEPLALFDGAPIAGTWSLLAHDRSAGDSGSVTAFALEIAPREWRCSTSATPIAGLSASNDGPTTLGQPTAFAATVTAGTAVTYAWDFGDGTSGSGAAPSHAYASPGTYTATVTASNTLGSATAATIVTVRPTPPDEFIFLPLIRR